MSLVVLTIYHGNSLLLAGEARVAKLLESKKEELHRVSTACHIPDRSLVLTAS